MKEAMQSFLIYSYFRDVNYDSLTEVCVNKAYKDLARNVPYLYSLSVLKQKGDKKKTRDYIKKKAQFKNEIVQYLVNEVDGEAASPREMINNVYKIANSECWKDLFGKKKFYYGLAQKWVNMSLKYLWLFDKCYLDEKMLDVPLDSRIIEVISKKSLRNKYSFKVDIEDINEVKWSTLDNIKLYTNIQDEIKIKVESFKDFNSSIEWENKAWIEQAKQYELHRINNCN